MINTVRPQKIMIVDDDRALLEALPETLLLRLPLVRVEPLASAEEALRRLAGGRYAVLVADLRMPQIDGLSLLRTVKRAGRDILVVIMSGDVDRPIVEQLLAEGADDVIAKPFDRIEFTRVVESTLERRRLARTIKAIRLALHHVDERSASVNGLSADAGASPKRSDRSRAVIKERLKAGEVHLLAARAQARDRTRQRFYASY